MSGKESNYEKLFDTPEWAAWIIQRMYEATDGDSCRVVYPSGRRACSVGDYDALLEWLRGDAE